MTTQKRRACNALIPLMLVLSCLLSACQNGPVDQAQTCEQRVIPVVTRLRPLQPVSEGIYVSNGDIIAAFNAGNGTVNWCSSISAGNGKDEFDGLNSQSGSLYAYTEAGTLTSFRAEAGTVLWSTNIEEDAFFNMTPPALVQTTIYGGTNTLYALNTSDGSLRWQFALPAQAHVRYVPVTTDGALYASVTLASLPQQVYALDATNGTKQWLFSLSKTQGVFGQPIAGDGVVVFPYDEAGGPDDQLPGGLEALSASSGKLLWQKAIWTIGSLGVFGNRVIANGMLYVIEKPSESPNARPSLPLILVQAQFAGRFPRQIQTWMIRC